MSAFNGFSGRRVLSLESRRARDMTTLIAAYGGRPLVVPALVERPLGATPQALAFAAALERDTLAAAIFLTGTGTRALADALVDVLPRPALAAALNRLPVIGRGPKPVAALRELGVIAPRQVPRPHTWREVLQVVIEVDADSPLLGRRVGVQEYGAPSEPLVKGLSERGADVLAVPVYEWALPDDRRGLNDALALVVAGGVDVLLFTAAVQVHHLMRVAEDANRAAALRAACATRIVASIGPATSEALRRHGIEPTVEASRPNMGVLVVDAARVDRTGCRWTP